ADTGTDTAWASSLAWVSASSRCTSPSKRPSVAAKPLLVVATAEYPSETRILAEPTSQALGISRGLPGTWRSRNADDMPRTLAKPAAAACHGWGMDELMLLGEER